MSTPGLRVAPTQRACGRHPGEGCDCVAPITPPKVLGESAPAPMDHHEKMRLRTAAFRATKLYPGPLGELVSRELLTWEEFGYRLGRGTNSLVLRLVEHVEKQP